MTKSKCRSCEAEIIWVKTPTRKNMPLNVKPVKMFVIDSEQDEPPIGSIKDCYIPHWATCPDATKWKLKGKSK